VYSHQPAHRTEPKINRLGLCLLNPSNQPGIKVLVVLDLISTSLHCSGRVSTIKITQTEQGKTKSKTHLVHSGMVKKGNELDSGGGSGKRQERFGDQKPETTSYMFSRGRESLGQNHNNSG
jgi:hypothetical protein